MERDMAAEIAVLQEQMRRSVEDRNHLWAAVEPLRAVPAQLDRIAETVAASRKDLRDHMDQELSERAEADRSRRAMWVAFGTAGLSAAAGLAQTLLPLLGKH